MGRFAVRVRVNTAANLSPAKVAEDRFDVEDWRPVDRLEVADGDRAIRN
jgi:hypothetical protein